jgi:hypothetical protein
MIIWQSGTDNKDKVYYAIWTSVHNLKMTKTQLLCTHVYYFVIVVILQVMGYLWRLDSGQQITRGGGASYANEMN